MDPNATLREIGLLGPCPEAADLCENLLGWCQTGGFHPDWSAHETGAAVFRGWLVAGGRSPTEPPRRPQETPSRRLGATDRWAEELAWAMGASPQEEPEPLVCDVCDGPLKEDDDESADAYSAVVAAAGGRDRFGNAFQESLQIKFCARCYRRMRLGMTLRVGNASVRYPPDTGDLL